MTCARSLPSCRGTVRLYRLALRPVTEVHRLCQQCVADLSGAPLHLEFIATDAPLPAWRQRSLARDFTGSAA